jgi:colanic acid biosynthesis glycosyl transferase WcaI
VYGYAHSTRDAVADKIKELSDELMRRGHDVEIRGIPEASIVAAGGPFAAKVRRLVSELVFLLRTSVEALTSSRGVDVYVTVDVPSGVPFVGRMARLSSRGRLLDVAWVMDLYRLDASAARSGCLNRLRAALERRALRSAQKVTTLGACMAVKLSEIVPAEAHVIPLWHMEQEPLPVGVPRDETAPLRLLYSGSAREIHPLKGIITAVAGLESVELRIAGTGLEVQRAEELVRSVGASNVTVTGPVPFADLSSLYASADMHVVALAEDATGTCVPSKTYAALASARGVIYLGDPGGQAALDVAAAGAGAVFGTSDVNGIRTALNRLKSNREELRTYSERAIHYMRDSRSVVAAADRWESLIDSARS